MVLAKLFGPVRRSVNCALRRLRLPVPADSVVPPGGTLRCEGRGRVCRGVQPLVLAALAWLCGGCGDAGAGEGRARGTASSSGVGGWDGHGASGRGTLAPSTACTSSAPGGRGTSSLEGWGWPSRTTAPSGWRWRGKQRAVPWSPADRVGVRAQEQRLGRWCQAHRKVPAADLEDVLSHPWRLSTSGPPQLPREAPLPLGDGDGFQGGD